MNDAHQALTRRSAIATLMMAGSAATAQWMIPTTRLARQNGGIDLEADIPRQFGAAWQMDTNTAVGVVNPQTRQLIDVTYNQVLTRIYLDGQGARVMLSIAYGEDQTDTGVELHHPEVCYPAQGFQIRSLRRDIVQTPMGGIPVRRMESLLGTQRPEPVTYWIMIGTRVALGGFEKKLAEIGHGLKGEVADGLLFRVSTIDRDSARGFATHDRFVAELIPALPARSLRRITGLT